MFYFAYGHNMDEHMMQLLCPQARLVRPAALIGHALFFDGYSTRFDGATVNMDYSMDDEVWGGLFEVTEQDLARIDFDEGCPRYCRRKAVMVGDAHAQSRVEAWVYQRDARPTGTPSSAYLQHILKGAEDCRLPAEYIQRNFAHFRKVYGL